MKGLAFDEDDAGLEAKIPSPRRLI
jgi:hypothetical protein